MVTGLILSIDIWSPLVAAEPSGSERGPESPLSAEESLEHMQLHPQLRIDLVAAEPEVVDPVAIRFDEEGRLWVVEMRDYPHGPDDGQPPLSRIKLLRDRDGDGRYETGTVFADQLLFANGLQPWRGGVVVTLSGEVAYFQDTDGDGRADRRETWFSGFAEKNPQLRANHPTFALDNSIYVANGLRGGDVIAKRREWRDGAESVSISGRDVRFDPLTGTYEAVSGRGQFGLTFDGFGRRFVCDNRHPCRHIVLEDRYLRRNPYQAVEGVAHDVAAPGEQSRVFPISRAWTTSNLHAGQFTAACGVTIYRGDRLPAKFRGNCFTCEPTGNLVHREVLRPDGATFTSDPGREGVEFLASPDEWFRPVNLETGPDGALYVVDMYRAVIEHPQFMPDELKDRPDLRDGDDRGRIYRIVPAEPHGGARPDQRDGRGRTSLNPRPSQTQGVPPPALSDLASTELVDLLEHPNAWQRETAARLLIERHDESIRDDATELVRTGSSPQARVGALWLLKGLGLLTEELLQRALADEHPRVREQAVRLAEGWLEQNEGLRRQVLELARDGDARLRFQVALSLGETERDESVLGTLASIGVRDADDRWTRAAVASSVPEQPLSLLKLSLRRLIETEQWDRPGVDRLIAGIAELIGARHRAEEIQPAVSALTSRPSPDHRIDETALLRIQIAGLNGLGEGLQRRGEALAGRLDNFPEALQEKLASLFRRTRRIAVSEEADVELRQRAVSALRYAEGTVALEPLQQLAAGDPAQSIRRAAVRTLSTFDEDGIGPFLLAQFPSQTPSVRRAILDALLASADRTRMLLEALESERIAVSELGPGRVNRLTRHGNAEIRTKAKRLLAAAVPEDRRKVIEDYRKALTLTGDPQRGREIFRKNCATCHRIGETGVDVAPDISDSRTKTAEELLVSILDPNRAIDNNYFSYTVVTKQGRAETGIIATETASSITLKQAEGKTTTLLRQDIERMQSNRVSLMPEGLEKNINKQQMADLISFIKNWRYLKAEIPVGAGE